MFRTIKIQVTIYQYTRVIFYESNEISSKYTWRTEAPAANHIYERPMLIRNYRINTR